MGQLKEITWVCIVSGEDVLLKVFMSKNASLVVLCSFILMELKAKLSEEFLTISDAIIMTY